MPFTFAHPVIILPFNRLPKKYFSLIGLIIGSLSPDFEYFIRFRIFSIYSHTIDGIFWFDLPLSIIVFILFHYIIRDSLYNNLPTLIRSRILNYKTEAFKLKFWVIMSTSMIIGAATHLLWDSFTHESGYFVQNISFLNSKIEISTYTFPLFKFLQQLSSFIGLLFLFLVIFRLPKTNKANTPINKRYWVILTGIGLSLLIARVLLFPNLNQFGNITVSAISAIFLSAIITPNLVKIIKKIIS